VAWTPLVPRRRDDAELAQAYLDTVRDLERTIETQVIAEILRRAPLVEDAHPFAAILATLASLKQVYNTLATVTASRISRIFNGIRFRLQQTARQNLPEVVGSIGGFEIAPIMKTMQDVIDTRVAANVSLIKSIPQQMFTQIEQVVANGIVGGQGSTAMIDQIRAVYPVTEKRARLIARDQIGKIYSDIERQRQQDAGVTEYMWQTAGDSRVRPTHRANEGKIFQWNNPPEMTGHPGTAINCRCVAIPVVDL